MHRDDAYLIDFREIVDSMAEMQRSMTPIILLVVAIVSVQGGAALAKTLFAEIGPEGVTAWRLGFSAIILLLVFQPWKRNLPKKNRINLLYYGIAIGTMNFLFYQSLNRLHIGIAVGLEFTGPLLVAILSSRRPVDFIWILLVIAGLLFLLPWGENSDVDPIGVLYALSAGAFWALYIIFGQKTGMEFGISASGIGLGIGALIYFPVGLAMQGSALFSLDILPLAFGVALLSSAIPFALELYVLAKLPKKTFGTLTSLDPAFGALAGFFLLNEILTVTQWCALLAIIVASVGASSTGR